MSVVLQPQTSDNFYQSFVAPAWNGSSRNKKSEIKKNRRKNREKQGSYQKRAYPFNTEHDHHYHKKTFYSMSILIPTTKILKKTFEDVSFFSFVKR